MLERLGLVTPSIEFTPEHREMAELIHHRMEGAYKLALHEGRNPRGHGIDHNLRVAGTSLVLACNESLDPFWFWFQAEVHDLGRTGNDPRARNRFHGQLSVEMLQNLFDELGLESALRADLEYAIGVHPFRNDEVQPTTYLQVLQDADRLDQLSGHGPFRSGAIYGDSPIIAPQTKEGTAEADIVTVRQDLDRNLEWQGWLWTSTAKIIAADATPILRELRRNADERSLMAYEVFHQLGLTINLG